MVMQRSCSSFLVSVALVSPAFEAAMIPACGTWFYSLFALFCMESVQFTKYTVLTLETRESVRVDLP